MPMWDDAEIDRAIENVAREMTRGEPHGDVRARVVARIDERAGRARWSRPRAFAGMVAATAIVLVALVAYRQFAIQVRPEVRPEVRLKPDTTYGLKPSFDTLRTAPSRVEGPRRTEPRAAIPPSAVDALAPSPLAVDPLAVDSLDASPLDVVPLDSIAPLDVAPLAQGDRP